MGQVQSLRDFPESHVKIYRDLLRIQTPQTRVGMIRTLLAGQEYIQSARAAGVYANFLAYIAQVEAGQRPAPLPGEPAAAMVGVAQAGRSQNQIVSSERTVQPTRSGSGTGSGQASAHVTKGRRNEKALTYFQNCLYVLGLQEEVALTAEALKKAYKVAALRAHPDKGGSEQEFEAITRAHAYLGEILLRIQGGRTKESVVEAPNRLQDTRKNDSKQWEMVEPVRLNPQKLDMNAFNQMFEQTRMPDPDEEGYGDWLKGAGEQEGGKAFSGKFNRDVFNRAFEDEAKKRMSGSTADIALRQPEALTLSPTHGVELGRQGGNYTAAANASLKFTDLRNAYTVENTITNQVADVRVEARNFDAYSSSRKKAPEPMSNAELAGVQAAEAAAAKREEQRRLRAAQEDSLAGQYFERMKRLVITNK
jgi:curved DNA-binding protein CbpA